MPRTNTNLLRKSVNYGQKKFYNIGTWSHDVWWFDLDAFVSAVSDDVSPVAEVEANSGDDHEDEDGDETNDHAYKEAPDTGLLGVNQVQVPASSWQHGSQVSFATFI